MKLSEPDKVEGVRCKPVPVSKIGYYESDIIPQMEKLMYVKMGVGLAAPQIGINRTFFIMKYGNDIISCYNPLWTPKSNKQALSREGCLTYQPTYINQKNVFRYKIINTEFTNSEGITVKIKMRGIDAIIFQYETDHLTGKTIFYDPEKA
ncbi:MAG: peptide deformylase [Spirochaetia bacterium]|jgi:peptide deformylase|nr:peptide deformylase [Spirochaetia bacterium]